MRCWKLALLPYKGLLHVATLTRGGDQKNAVILQFLSRNFKNWKFLFHISKHWP